MAKDGNTNSPSASVTVLTFSPVAELLSCTLAFGSSAPVESVTLPLKLPRVICAELLEPTIKLRHRSRVSRQDVENDFVAEFILYTSSQFGRLLCLSQSSIR